MAEIELLRPKEAAARYHVARQTLGEWASRGLIGRVKVGRVTLYPAGDIAELLARGLTPRRAVRIEGPCAVPSVDWRNDPFWRGATADER